MPLPAERRRDPRAGPDRAGGGLLTGAAGIPRSVKRVQLALHAGGVETQVHLLGAAARTAPEAADAVGCELGAIVKSLVFSGRLSGGPLLALVSGANQADVGRLEEGFGEPVDRADPNFVRAVTGFAIGGVPPVAHATPMRPLIDEDLTGHDLVWCSAGAPTALFAISPGDLVRVTGGRVVALAARGQSSSPSST